MPVVVIDAVNTATPVTYDVHTDHLMRPLKMTAAAKAVAWDAVWKPFGETFSITSAPKLDLGFPGHWTQSENGLAWNRRRHYDRTTGRYTKPALRFVDGLGLYGYAGQRPNVLIDPEGLEVVSDSTFGHCGTATFGARRCLPFRKQVCLWPQMGAVSSPPRAQVGPRQRVRAYQTGLTPGISEKMSDTIVFLIFNEAREAILQGILMHQIVL